MTKSLRKDFGREIKKNFSRFISILLIAALGVAFYSGIRSAMPAMHKTADKVYDAENFMDIRVIGTLGLTRNDLNKIKGVQGVNMAEGSIQKDYICLVNSNEIVTKIMSMPETINDVKVSEGRFPTVYNECVVSREFIDASGLKIGDSVAFTSGSDEDIFDTLAADTYTIVGIGSTSYFLNGDMGTSSIGDGIVDGYIVIPEEAFVIDYYTNVHVLVDGAKELNCYSDEYKEKIQSVIDAIKNISDKRCAIRFSEVRAKSAEMLQSAVNDYNKAKLTAETELAESYQKLLDTEAMLQDAREKFEEEKQVLANAETELPLRKQQIAEAEKEIAEGEKELNRMEASYEEQKGKVQVAKDAYEQMLQDPNVTDQELEEARNALLLVTGIYDTLEKQMKAKRTELEDGKKEVAEGKKTIAEVEKVLADKSAITETEKKLTDAEIELQRGKEQYEIAKQDAIDELADAKEKLSKAETDINNMEMPVWYVLDRTSVESNMSFTTDAESIGAIGTVFPIIFFIVAALVALTTMTRMVEEQRTQIGTLKALGYSKKAIASKYIYYALYATLIGGVIGVVVGEYTIPTIIVSAYKMVYYNLGESVIEFNALYGLTAVVVAVICTVGAAYFACHKTLLGGAAELMRPEAPKAGKRIFLEKTDAIWERLDFGQKAAMRNLFRYKKRFFMTLFGVGGCMALLLVGFGIRDSVSAMANNQYGEVFQFDGIVSVDSTLTRAQRRAMLADISDLSDVESGLQANRIMVYATNSNDAKFENEENAYMVVPRNIDDFKQFIKLEERTGLLTDLNLTDDGVIITEKYANMLGVGVGDSIFIRKGESDAFPKEVKITGITENYIFHYIYMTPNLYQTIYNESADLNTIYIKTTDAVNVADFSEQILKINGVNTITMNENELNDIKDVINRLYFVIVIMILAAGALAFIVLYNLNNINITERRRELATLKLLGFYDNETAAYVFRENIVLTILGTILGIFLGIVLHKFVMVTVETDIYMFGRELQWYSILIGAILTVLFSLIVNFVMYFKLKKIDMIESLKSVE